jgi:Holliday junction resolvase RusA-like endonuclease
MEIEFTVIGRPQQRGSKKAGLVPDRNGGFLMKNGRPIVVARDANDNSKAWMDSCKLAACMVVGREELLRGPIELQVTFFFKRPGAHYGTGSKVDRLKPSAPEYHAQSPDLDKLVRCLGDALTGVVYVDDRQVCRTISAREWTTTTERAEVKIIELATSSAKPKSETSQLALGLE